MPAPYDLVMLLRRAVLLSALLYAGYQDYKTREIDDRTWIYPAILLAPLTFFEVYNRDPMYLELYLASVLFGLATALMVLRLGLMGEADAIAFAYISLFEPPSDGLLAFQPLVSVVIFSFIPTLLYVSYNLYWNLRRGSFKGYEASLPTKLLAFLTMRYITRRQYEEKRYMYFPSTRKQGDRLVIEFSPTITESIDEPELEEFWATPLLPYVTFLSIGCLIYAVSLLASA